MSRTFYEFFAGGGMARAGLGPQWQCTFANDIDAKKARSYAVNWGDEQLRVDDVAKLATTHLPGRADLAWASFPCQDLSLAGDYAGLKGRHSGTFWPFWRLMEALTNEGRAPSLVALENVCGALTSHEGKDFSAIGSALAGTGYRFGALVIDAVHFLPQSRPRLFIVGVHDDRVMPANLVSSDPSDTWHPANLVTAYERLPLALKTVWRWWRLPLPSPRTSVLSDFIDEEPSGVTNHTVDETQRLVSLMSPLNHHKLEQAQRMGRQVIGGIYRRTRVDENGKRVQRAEIRFDDVAGCLRTPTGGSSRQSIMVVEKDCLRSRLLSPREAARLMGLSEDYRLPSNYNEAYHLAGDGVAVPVVRFLAAHLLEPLLDAIGERDREAA